MGIDPLSFLLGFGTASGLSYTAYRNRERLSQLLEPSEQGAATGSGLSLGAIASLRDILRQSTDARYETELAEYLQKRHLGGDLVSLLDILIEPRLLTLPKVKLEFDDPNAAPSLDSYEYIVPRIHEFPQLVSSYYMESLPLSDVVAGDPHVMLLGNPGMGKSTALVTLALMALGKISFETLQSITEQALEEAYADLNESERERRLNELKEIEKKIVERLQETEQDLTSNVKFEPPPPMTTFFPVFVDVGTIDLDLNNYGMKVDPAEPLVRAFQQYASLVSAQTSPPIIYRHLTDGNCIVLLDGFEELPESNQKHLYGWLQSFMQYYGHNRIVMTGPVNAYDALLSLGFTPVYIKPWSPDDALEAVEKWLRAWNGLAETQNRRSTEQFNAVNDAMREKALTDVHHRSPLEVVLRTLASLRNDTQQEGARGWFESYVRRFVPDTEHSYPILREVASLMLERDQIFMREQIAEVISKRLIPNEEAEALANVDNFTQRLLDGGLLVKRSGNKLDFRHALFRSYFAGEALIHDMSSQRRADLGEFPSWHFAFRYAASAVDLTGAVGKKLATETDILLNNLFSLADWLPDAPTDSKWRAELLKRMTAVLLSSSQFMTLRERALAALIASRDENLISIFRQAVRSGNPSVRKLGCLGIGAIRATGAVADLRPMLVDDNHDVQVAAGLALGAIADEAALEIMVQGLLQGGESLRQVIAQSLAGIATEGHNILRDAAEHDDMGVRRASVFGLARIPANWSLIALYNLMINDEQWYVRSSAEDRFFVARNPERPGPRKAPRADELPWLRAWASNVGLEEFPEGEPADDLLIQTLRDKRSQVRLMATQALGRMGVVKGIMPLYAMLMDRDAKIRTEAYSSLSLLQTQMTTSLPGVL